jgi:cation:H+ antiporter
MRCAIAPRVGSAISGRRYLPAPQTTARRSAQRLADFPSTADVTQTHMLGVCLQFIIAAAIVVAAGTMLTRYADALADLTKLSRLVIGTILLAAATSLPELSVDLSAVRQGLPDLAVGDLMGSNLYNLLILATLDLSHRSRGRMLTQASASHALSATFSIAMMALAGAAILARPAATFAGVSLGALTLPTAYLLGVRAVFSDQRMAAQRATSEADVVVPAGTLTLRRAALGFIAATAAILVAAPYLAEAAGRLAELSGLGTTFFGTALVALCTSLPELVATIVAVRIGAFDLAVGNIFGSNAFNMLLLVALDLAYPGSLLADISPTHVLTCLSAIVVTAVAVMGQLYRVEQRIHFLEPDAALVILLVAASLVLVYVAR